MVADQLLPCKCDWKCLAMESHPPTTEDVQVSPPTPVGKEQEVMKDTSCNKYLFTFYNVALFESMIQHLPPLL